MNSIILVPSALTSRLEQIIEGVECLLENTCF